MRDSILMDKQVENLKKAQRGVIVSTVAYIIQTVLKLTVGVISGSQALIADGLHNLTDILSSIAILIGIRIAMKPKDDGHPYGHLRAETIASLVVSILMIIIGIKVITDSFGAIAGSDVAPDIISAYIALACSAMMFGVYKYSSNLARKTNSSGLMTTAKDNLADGIVGIGAALGIIASQFGMPWIDPVVAIVVGIIIIKTGWDIFYESTNSLMDGIDKEKLDEINKLVHTVRGVNQVSRVRGRESGNKLIIDLVIYVDKDLSVVQGHDIAELVQQKLCDEMDCSEAIVHVEPYLQAESGQHDLDKSTS